MNNLTTKVYKFDFKFILDNYLDKRLWKKTWKIFEYDDIKVNMKLGSIDIDHGRINLIVYLTEHYWEFEFFNIQMHEEHYNEVVLRKELLNTVFHVLRNRETSELRDSSGYLSAIEVEDEHREQLIRTAENFLDEEGVTNEEIRDAYIDMYVDKHEIHYAEDYKMNNIYNLFTDKYLAVCAYFDDKETFEFVKERGSRNELEAKEILEQVEEMRKKLEDDGMMGEMQELLEEI